MARDPVIEAILAREGSVFSDDPADHGGATKFGVTLREYMAWRQYAPAQEGEARVELMALTEDEARAYYGWKLPALGFEVFLSDTLRAVMFDMAVLQGKRGAVKVLQRALRVTPDGLIGPVTLAAVAAADERALLKALVLERVDALIRTALADVPAHVVQATNLKWLRGWWRRAWTVGAEPL